MATFPAAASHRPLRERGFTLVEGLVVLAIVGVLVRVASVSLQQASGGARLSAAAFQLVGELNHARTEAIRRDMRVVLCKSADGETCTSGGGWEQGWIVFVDGNNNALREASETLVRRGEGLPGGLRITGNEPVASYVSFSPPFGGARFTSGAFQAGTITLCRDSGQGVDGRQLIINSVGRARSQKVALERCE